MMSSSNNLYPSFGGGLSMSSLKTENFTAYTFSFEITKDELTEFSISDIELIRIPDTGEEGFVDLKAKKRTKPKTKAIKKAATCIKNYL